MKDKARKLTTTPGSEPPPAEEVELPERWSVQRKTELILRLLRGEALDADEKGWRATFDTSGMEALRSVL